MDLVTKATPSRIVPVGRLDCPTTGLLLFTNDGDLAKKLTHPSSMVKKLYHVVLSKSLKPHDLAQIRRGLTLDDGPVKVDEVSYVQVRVSEKLDWKSIRVEIELLGAYLNTWGMK